MQRSLHPANATGDFADTSVDHDRRVTGKKFHHSATYPTLQRFIHYCPAPQHA